MRKPNKPETADSATKTPSPFSSCKYFNLDFRKYHKVELNKGFILCFYDRGKIAVAKSAGKPVFIVWRGRKN